MTIPADATLSGDGPLNVLLWLLVAIVAIAVVVWALRTIGLLR